MLSHRRGRSLSEALTLEQSEEGRLVVSSISDNASADQGLREGDEVLGATINFDQLSKDEVLNVLKLIEPYNDKIQVLTRSNLSKSLGNLDQCAKDPETMLKDSYSKLYNTKIKRFMRGDLLGAEEMNVNGEATAETNVPSSSTVNLKHNMGLPRLGVDFGLLKTKTFSTDVNADSQSDDAGELTYGSNLNLPPLGLSSNGTVPLEAQVPKLKVDARSLKTPESITGPSFDTDVPEVAIEETDKELNMPFKLSNLDISGPSFNGQQSEIKTSDVGTPDVPSGKLSLKLSKRLKNPDLNVDDPSSYAELPKLKLSGRSPDLNLEMPSARQLDLNGSDIDMPSSEVKVPKIDLKSPDLDVDASSGKLNVKSSDVSLKKPKIKGDFQAHDVNLPKSDLKGPNSATGVSSIGIKGPSGKYKAPKFTMPKFDLPEILVPQISGDLAGLKGPKIHGNLDGPDMDISTPNVNLKGPKADFRMPDADISGLSGKFKKPNLKMPDWRLSAPNLDGPNLDLESPDLDISGPNLEGGISAPDINMPKVDISSPKLDLSSPKLNLDMPSGKLKMPELHTPDWDINAPSGKFKLPKFKSTGTLPKGPNLDLNTDIETPDLSLKTPKIKGGIDAPSLDLPNMDLKAPKFNVGTPDVNIGSPKTKLKMPKLKMPKIGFSNLKGPEIDGTFDSPDADFSAPNVNLRGSKPGFEMPDVDFGSPSGKLKKPHLKMPDVGFSSPKLDGPNFDLKSPNLNAKLPKGLNLNVNPDLTTPDFNLKTPKMKGRIDSPKLGLPNMDLKTPKLDVNSPDVDIGFPDAKFKMPKMPKGPNININGDLQQPHLNVPNLDISGQKGKLKMPNLNAPDLNISGPSVKKPDIDLSVPKLQGPAFSFPDLRDARLQDPKLDFGAKCPDLGINGNMGKPDMGLTAPQIKGELGGPNFDINIPSGNIQGPQTDLDMADRRIKLPSFKLPQFGSPDLNRTGSDIDFGASLRPRDVDISPPNAKLNMKPPGIKGNITGPKVSAPNINVSMPNAAMRNPQLHLKNPNLNIDHPSLNFRGPSYKNRRSDITGVNMKMPALDVDGAVNLSNTGTKPLRTKGLRPNYPLMDAHQGHLGHNINFNRTDLNIDDFTGKEHVLRARGSKLNHQSSYNYGQVVSPSGVNIDMTGPRHGRYNPPGSTDIYAKPQRTMQPISNARLAHSSQGFRMTAPDSTDGYYVTVFPSQGQNQTMPNRKYNTLGWPNFHPRDVDLEVPCENELKGSTFVFSNLV